MRLLPALQLPGWAIAVLLAVIAGYGLYLPGHASPELTHVVLLQSAVYALGVLLLVKGRLVRPGHEREALLLILGLGLALRIAALFYADPNSDIFRYVWDGRVQNDGINPYRYLPVDPALAHLRDAAIYPYINRADYAHTIYPPAAQLFFAFAARVHDSMIAMKALLVACECAAVAGILWLLRRHGRPLTWVLIYAWHPLALWEFSGNGHLDAIALPLVVLAWIAAERRATFWSGAALAAATLVKYYPIVVAPGLHRRRDWKAPLGFLLTAALLYLPYLSAGSGLLGFMPGYAKEERLTDGNGFYLWALAQRFLPLPEQGLYWYAPIAATVLLLLALWLWWRRGDRIDTAPLMALPVAFTVLLSPHMPWYFVWLLPFACLRPSASVIWLTGASSILYVSNWADPVRLSWLYGPYFALMAFELWRGRGPSSSELPEHERRPQILA